MEVTVRHLGGVKFEAATRGISVISDQPVDNGGEDSGMTPPEFLLAALGTCAGYYAAQYLKTRSLSQEGLGVKVIAEKAAGPARLGAFRVEVTVPELEERHLVGIERAVRLCTVHNTLTHTPTIETMVLKASGGDSALVGEAVEVG